MFKIYNCFLFVAFITFALSCSTSKKIKVVQEEPVKVTKADFGEEGFIQIPGEWTLSSENKLTNQKFFRNKDSVLIAITRNPMEKYSFYAAGMKDSIFTETFFRWESNHFEKQGLMVSVFEKHKGGEYIIWTVKGKEKVDALLLYGGKKNFGYALSLLEPKNLTINQSKAFLIQLFRDN